MRVKSVQIKQDTDSRIFSDIQGVSFCKNGHCLPPVWPTRTMKVLFTEMLSCNVT